MARKDLSGEYVDPAALPRRPSTQRCEGAVNCVSQGSLSFAHLSWSIAYWFFFTETPHLSLGDHQSGVCSAPLQSSGLNQR